MGSIIFVDGLALWPGLMEPVRERLRVTRPTHGLVAHNPLEELRALDEVGMADLLDPLRRRIEQAASPVTLVAQSLDATLALALALDPPPGLGSVIVHEPLVGPREPTLHTTVAHATDRLLDAGDPVEGAGRFLERLMGSDTWSRLHPTARGYARHHAAALRAVIPPVTAWSPEATTPRVTTFVTVGRGSAPMWHRAAQVIGSRVPHRSVGRGHVLSLDDPAALVELTHVASDAAEARVLAARSRAA